MHAHFKKVRINPQTEILISPGNWLNSYHDATGNSLIFQLLPEFGFDAIALGPLDLIGGYDFFAEQGRSASLPWVCSNLTYQGKRFARPYHIIKRAWGSVLVTSVISPRRFLEIHPQGIPAGISFDDPVRSLEELTKAGNEPATVTVIVSYMEPEQERRLLDGWDPARPVLFLRYGEVSRLDTASFSTTRIVAEMGSGGRCVSTVVFDTSRTTLKFTQEVLDSTHPQDQAMSQLIDIHYRIRGSAKAGLNPAAPAPGQSPKALTFTLFYSPDCPDCHRLITEKLFPLERKELLRLDLVDISKPGNYRRLIALQKQKGHVTKNIPVAYYDGEFADGLEAIGVVVLSIKQQR